jgi:pyruvate dehydrogenase E1 component beta subunit
MVHRCLEAADRLAQNGTSCEVIDLRTLSPLDMDTVLNSVAKTSRVVTVDEGHKQCGAGAEVAARIADEGFNYLDAPIKRVAALDCPIPFSRPLEEAVIPSTDEIVRHIQKVLA